MNHVDIGDRVLTPDWGPGVIVNIERFDADGKPYYDTKRHRVDWDGPTGLNRWGVKLDDKMKAQNFTNGILYFVNNDLRREEDELS